jgi:hypothetical protein
MRNPSLWLYGGIAGAASIVCYIVAVAVPWPENQFGTSGSMIAISGFPMLGIVYSYALYHFVAADRDSVANRLGFVFAVTAFATLLAMLFVQLAVVAGIAEYTRELDAQTAQAVRRSLRLVDLGLDVAWDFLIGTGLVCWGLALRKRSGLGMGWAVPCVVFGVALIGLNAATFPIPPANHGLFDIGPFIAIFMLALAVRVAWLGWRASVEVVVPA